jgi:uncharacterized protein (TIGR03437 family)
MTNYFRLTIAVFAIGVSQAQVPVPLNQIPSRIVGHPSEALQPLNQWPNLVEGRELFSPYGVALDTSVTPAILYVADTGNNRVLGWKNAASFRNGDKADLVIGQSGSFFTTGAQGPGTNFTTGFFFPTGLLVDSNGNLLVADMNNNRILRFPKPFAQPGAQFPDLYIGQPNLSSKVANFTGSVNDQGLNLVGSQAPTTNMAFDADKNLWVTDGGNRRVLRFAAADVAAGGGPLRANLVLGQVDFTTVQPAVASASRTNAGAFSYPQSIAFDPSGRLYVSDTTSDRSLGRVLVFTPPFGNNKSAARIMGITPATGFATQDAADKTAMSGPTGIFFVPDASKMGVVDAFSHRILIFDSFEKWPDASISFAPQATAVIGQPDFHNRAINGNRDAFLQPPTGSTFSGPQAVVFSGNELFVADSGNNRVLALPLAGATFTGATRVLGQDSMTMAAINLVEGREFAFLTIQGSGGADSGVAIDETTETPHLFVADTYNHRILGFKDFRKVQAGSKADLVIGQPDWNSNFCNITGNPDAPTASSLCFPTGVTVDPDGNLYVADLGNGRVLRFPAPFTRQGQLPAADLVLGQRNFTTKITDPTSATMSQPYGLALSKTNGLFVSDIKYNRVLYIPFSSNNTFTGGTDNGRAATKVFGQPDFTTVTSGNSDTAMTAPHHLAADAEARLYVADSGNNRLLIFDQINLTPTSGAHATLAVTGLNQPRGVFVNEATGEIWVSEGGSNTTRRFPRYQNLILLSPTVATANYTVFAGSNALAIAQDQFGDLIVADASSRVGMYYPNLQAYNGGHFLASRAFLAPGLLASICSPGSACDPAIRTNLFGSNTEALGAFPMPRTLGDVQVLFAPSGGDLAPAPLYYVSPSQVNFVVPMNAPTSGNVDIQVVQPSTGRVFAAGQMPMNTAAPGILEMTYTGKNRQAALINADGTVNSPANRAARGSYVSLYATGQGFVPGAPADGELVTSDIRTPLPPRIALNGIFLDDYIKNPEDKPKDQWLYSSGLQQYPGLWQINFYIPSGVAPNAEVSILILAGNSILSTDNTINMTIAVK